MKHLNLRSLLVLAFLALPASPLVGQTEAQLRELKEQEARQRIEELLQQVQASHQEAAYRAQESRAELEAALHRVREEAFQAQGAATQEQERALRLALEEARQFHEQTAHQQERSLRIAREEARQIRQHTAQERERALRMVRENQERVRTRVSEGQERAFARMRAEIREQARDLQQVVVRVRAGLRLGVSLDPFQDEEYDEQGVLLKGILDDSPAEEAGLEEGDIITHLNGQSLVDPIDHEDEEDFDEEHSLPVQRLMALAGDLDDGDDVTVEYIRDGSHASVSFEAEEMDGRWVTASPRNLRSFYRFGPEGSRSIRLHIPDSEELHMEILPHLEDLKTRFQDLKIEFEDMDFEAIEFEEGGRWNLHASPNVAFFGGDERRFLRRGEGGDFQFFRGDNDMAWSVLSRTHRYGLELRELNPDLGSYFSAEEGVLVMEVDEDSTLGLRAGDVILRVGDRDVEDTGDFYRILGSYEEDENVTLTIMRNGQRTTVEGTAG